MTVGSFQVYSGREQLSETEKKKNMNVKRFPYNPRCFSDILGRLMNTAVLTEVVGKKVQKYTTILKCNLGYDQ